MTSREPSLLLDRLEHILKISSENIFNELSNRTTTLNQYAETIKMSEAETDTPSLNFDQINDLLCEQMLHTLHYLALDELATPEFRIRLNNYANTINELRSNRGRRQIAIL